MVSVSMGADRQAKQRRVQVIAAVLCRAAVVAAVLPAGTALAFAGSSSDCSPSKQTAWEEWKQAGETGDPPSDCASY